MSNEPKPTPEPVNLTEGYNGPMPPVIQAVPTFDFKGGYNGAQPGAPVQQQRQFSPPPPPPSNGGKK